MARRAQSGLRPLNVISLLALLAALLAGTYFILHRGSDPMTGITKLNAEEYLENGNALSGNVYRVEGTVDDRLDNWKSSEGRLFSVQVEDSSTFVPLWVPPSFAANIKRGQRYIFKVQVLETGILEVKELIKA